MKDIRNYNDKGELHGYIELYWGELRNKLLIRGNMKNKNAIGYEEWYGGEKTRYNIR